MRQLSYWIAVVAALVFTTSGCGVRAQAYPGYFKRESYGLIFDGDVNAANVGELRSSLALQDKLYITSRGGDPSSAMDLARIIQERNVSVEVNEYCVGVCASIVFLSSRTRAAELAPALRFTQVSADDSSYVRGGFSVDEYYEMLKRAGVSAPFTRCINRIVDDVSKSSMLRRPEDVEIVASPSVLRKFGIEVDGEYNWYHDADYRENYHSWPGKTIVWLDDPADCDEKSHALTKR